MNLETIERSLEAIAEAKRGLVKAERALNRLLGNSVLPATLETWAA